MRTKLLLITMGLSGLIFTTLDNHHQISLQASEIEIINILSEVDNSEYEYFEDGTLKQQIIHNQDGTIASITTYDVSGSLYTKVLYQDNLPLLMTEYYPNGEVKVITTYTEGYRLSAIEYNQNRMITHKYQYYKTGSARGEIEVERQINENGNVITNKQYDLNQKLLSVRTYSDSGLKTNQKNYSDGILSREYFYDNQGQILNRIDYNPNGQEKEQHFYKNGVRNLREVYGAGGQVTAKSTYKPDGSSYLRTLTYDNQGRIKIKYDYYPNINQLQMKSTYDPNKVLISRNYYYSNGKLKRSYKYENKKVISRDVFDSNGFRTRKDVYKNGIRRNTYVFNKDGSYSYAYYTKEQKLERRDYYNKGGKRYKVKSYLKTQKRSGYRNLKVATCDMSTTRLGKRVVDIGIDSKYTNRDYYAYTNGSGQLIRVEAAQIIPQNESYEKVVAGSNGISKELRYCKSQAPIKGTETSKYDRGHVIADSMGGAANVYNLTPQIKYLNRYGAQTKMENMFRTAFKNRQTVTDFDMKISYKNKKTTIPNKYTVSFKIDGKKYTFSEYNK